MLRAVWTTILLAVAPLSAQGLSNAAQYLIGQEVASACDGGRGSIAPSAVIERDLTGDGRTDLVISHEGIACAGGGRSAFCGAQVCSVLIYVRRGALLVPEVDDLLGQAVTVGDGSVPEIRWRGHGGAAHSMRWNGNAFR
jgi:hypothetical protein